MFNPIQNSLLTKTAIGLTTTVFILTGVRSYNKANDFITCINEQDIQANCDEEFDSSNQLSCSSELYSSLAWGVSSMLSFYMSMKIVSDIVAYQSELNENMALHSPSCDYI